MVIGNILSRNGVDELEEKDYSLVPDELKYTSVSLLEVFNNKSRLEAAAFNLDAKVAIDQVKKCKYGFVHFWSSEGLVDHASYPGRFKRIYVKKGEGEPFFLPSQLTELHPKPNKFISPKTYKSLNGVRIEPNFLLMTRSGTIGKCSISSRTNIGKLYSDDVIRISFKNSFDLGYAFAFFNTLVGQIILQTNNYGAVVQHIEPEHLESVIIPNAPERVKIEIHELIVASFDLRDSANELIDEAEKILYEELDLKPVEELKPKNFEESFDLRNYSISLSKMNYRLDSSYNIPIAQLVVDEISRNSSKIVKLSDVAERVILAGVFKRTYVDEENGVPFLGGRDITQLTPQVEKFLSREVHKDRIKKELEVFENYVLISDRGTIGKVQIVPKHWEGWTVSQNIIKVVPKTVDIAGYLYCFLNSDYGQILIKRETYGSVVDMIDDKNVKNIFLPLLKDKEKQLKINNMVLKANRLKYEAHLKQKEAIDKMNLVIQPMQGLKLKHV